MRAAQGCYNKRNPKKGIESTILCLHATAQARGLCYNKRNPKKGIESDGVSEARMSAQESLQQKKSQKGN
jgi:hypothetical protein